jgi:topoisomerase IA-like protein
VDQGGSSVEIVMDKQMFDIMLKRAKQLLEEYKSDPELRAEW